MPTFSISGKIDTTDAQAKLGMEIWVDSQQFCNYEHVSGPLNFNLEINEDEADHCLKFVMKHKTSDHTQLDDQGNIVKDASLIVSDLTFDQMPLGKILANHAVYVHDFNGTGQPIKDQFYGEMGCNGSVELNFSTPIYVWLLEHL